MERSSHQHSSITNRFKAQYDRREQILLATLKTKEQQVFPCSRLFFEQWCQLFGSWKLNKEPSLSTIITFLEQQNVIDTVIGWMNIA
jgi:hypothetical protein